MAHMTNSAVLAKWALPISDAILKWCISQASRLAGDLRKQASNIATRLHLISSGLDSLSGQFDDEVEVSCQKVLMILAGIYRPPHIIRASHLASECDRTLSAILAGPPVVKNKCLASFFCSAGTNGQRGALESYCVKLHRELFIEESNLPLNIRNLVSTKTPESVSDHVLDELEQHMMCDSVLHRKTGAGMAVQSAWHPARICLAKEISAIPTFNFIVSTMGMAYWQDFLLELRAEDNSNTDHEPIHYRRFCSILDTESHARIALTLIPSQRLSQSKRYRDLAFAHKPGGGKTLGDVLASYELKVEDKLVLAFNIARAYMLYYDSKLMRVKWTSRNVHFMPMYNEVELMTDKLPLRAYISFPTGHDDNSSVDEYITDESMTHCYPLIFDLGVLILEIGLCKALPSLPGATPTARVNNNHRRAKACARELKNAEWAGFEHKSVFDEVVDFCFDVRQAQPSVPSSHASTNMRRSGQAGIAERKRLISDKIVRPLAWLVNEGFGNPDRKTSYITKKQERSPDGEHGRTSEPQQPPSRSEFHGGRAAKSIDWLNNLCKIGRAVGKQTSSRWPVIAILDTGLDVALLSAQFGEDAVDRIRFKDFVNNTAKVDECGHGTLMVGLALKCAPLATIVVARVAVNSKDLEGRQASIAEAIKWAAGSECNADIISMSFGFPKTDPGLERAIGAASTARNKALILLASAGNSASEIDSSPARLDTVMSIHATDPYGHFLHSSSQQIDYGPVALGTYGDGLPREFLTELCSKYPHAAQPGSSIATAVAAGVCATMLAYVGGLSEMASLHITDDHKRTMQLVRETKGMETLFRSMEAKCVHRELWVDPISFWRNCGSHDARYRAILSCMEKYDQRK
ncbi:subtilisin [Microdochium nivale]|nr:subtilisin [Microdochium nivale]